ncbi:inositol monophosphatase family protein [Pseudaestuariivita atlantica]|uniref:Inositol monophosphatase n=1 Tax=Pseudaestuariivita atlantica TaxID=1317121 RepID=A0A0L1JP94_9RHOB|nr:3'(2'),5'-bisphosphate nucleotidase CysQ [Pseudaestuariivita atlantica]KNG93590.1 inositol monophosphatase [Pseudaestuariivita atlantica]
MPDDLSLLIEAAREAGEIATRIAGPDARRWDKPGDAGPVTEADLAVDTHLRQRLRGARPGYGWLSEESEADPTRLTARDVFIVDPIDGTRSFIEGSKTWAHSLAIARDGEVTAAVVYLPQRDLMYVAEKGGGATLNDAPLTASARQDVDGAEVLIAKPGLAPALWPNGVPPITRAYRPSLAYRLALVAEGRFDAMLTVRATWEWDIAAGALLATEAGALATDPTGAPLRFNSPTGQTRGILASAPALHPALRPAVPGA